MNVYAPIEKRIRWLGSWSLYWLGHFVSMPMMRWELDWLYPLYNQLMLYSGSIQRDGKGPWRPARSGAVQEESDE